jgi:hypothetical protein
MDRPRQRTEGTAKQCRPCHGGYVSSLGLSFLLLFAGCAQFDQLMGKQAASAEPQPPAQSANPAPNVSTPASEKSPVQAGESAPKPTAKKKTDGSHPASVANEPHPHAPAHQVAPTAGTAKQLEPELKQADQDKKEKKSHVAADKKSTKKSPKSQAESQPPTEDVFLSPVPLPSKPAAIGGSGG